jgi:hypothetical protein
MVSIQLRLKLLARYSTPRDVGIAEFRIVYSLERLIGAGQE